MKAEIVYNRNNEVRVLIHVETQEERDLFKDSPDLNCIRTGRVGSKLMDLAYVICEEK